MIINLIISLLGVTGACSLWNNFLHDSPKLTDRLVRIPFFGTALTCRMCQSFWFSLAFLFLFNPLPPNNLPLRFEFLSAFGGMLNFLLLWLAFGSLVLLTRFLTQELFSIGGFLEARLHREIHKH